ncbi:MAG: Na+ dependent nucleoside transporter N-terminal domain-containing protein, partial [Flavobacteriaceae bacterium]
MFLKMNELLPHSGASFLSMGRGALGMVLLVGLAFLLSTDRKNIPWKTVGLGLLVQFFIALG